MTIRDQERREDLEKYFEVTGDLEAAQALESIYIQGTCNSLIPEIHKAYKYCRIVYEGSRKKFLNGTVDGQFAFAAYRLGSMLEYGIAVEQDRRGAYCRYLEADCALRLQEALRTRRDPEDGDLEILMSSVRESIDRTAERGEEKSRDVDTLEMLNAYFREDFPVEMLFQAEEVGQGDAMRLTVRIRFNAFAEDGMRTRALVLIPERDFCELRETCDVTFLCRRSESTIPAETGYLAVEELKADEDGIVRILRGGELIAEWKILKGNGV